MNKTSITIASALDRLQAELSKDGISLPRHRLKQIAATVAGCRNDNEYVRRASDLYPQVERVETLRDCYGQQLHVLKDPRSGRLYAVDSASLSHDQPRAGHLQPCPYGGMVDVSGALLAPPADAPEPVQDEDAHLPLFRFHLTRAATETASVEVRAETVEEAFEKALHRDFWSDPARADFVLDEGNWPERPYIPDEDDYEMIAPGEE